MAILTGIEVDILEDGSLDQEPELLERLDVVVASVPFQAVDGCTVDDASNDQGRAESPRGCVRALAPAGSSPATAASAPNRSRCGRRCLPPAARNGTAGRDQLTSGAVGSPPTRLLNLALEIGCLFSIDTDSHAPGQLEFPRLRRPARALDAGVPTGRIVNTWPAEKLLEWNDGLVRQVRHLQAGVAAE